MAGLIPKTIKLPTTSAAKVFEVKVGNCSIGDYVDVNIDAGGVDVSIFRALLTHDGNSFYISRLSNKDSVSGYAYYVRENGLNTFYIKISEWGHGTIVFKNTLKVSTSDVTSSFDSSKYLEV